MGKDEAPCCCEECRSARQTRRRARRGAIDQLLAQRVTRPAAAAATAAAVAATVHTHANADAEAAPKPPAAEGASWARDAGAADALPVSTTAVASPPRAVERAVDGVKQHSADDDDDDAAAAAALADEERRAPPRKDDDDGDAAVEQLTVLEASQLLSQLQFASQQLASQQFISQIFTQLSQRPDGSQFCANAHQLLSADHPASQRIAFVDVPSESADVPARVSRATRVVTSA